MRRAHQFAPRSLPSNWGPDDTAQAAVFSAAGRHHAAITQLHDHACAGGQTAARTTSQVVVSIGKLGSGARSERYYTDAVARGREDYYAGAGEAPGRWLGQGAAALGLCGEVSADGLSALMQGRDPASGERLRRTLRDGAVTGFDLTFSAPKSVSILYGAAPDEVSRQAREAHDRAVQEALAYLEREACQTRRGTDGVERLPGEGFVAAAFRHRTSRAGDPQLHTHVVVANLTKAEGRYSTLDGRLLYAHAKTAGYLYQATLRAELSERLGLEWGPVRNGTADLVAVPREVIDHFSSRRAEVVEELERQGTHSAQAARIAALDTRRGKDYAVSVDRLRAEWRSRAEEFGLGRALAARPLARQSEGEFSDEEAEEHGRRLAGPHGLTTQQSTFDRRDVVRAFAEAHPQGASVERVEELAERFLSSAHAVQLESPALGPVRAGGPRYSTPELLALERALVDGAERRRAEGAAVAAESEVEAAIEARPTLSGEQRAIVRGLCSSGDGVQLVRGRAGTGKTFSLDTAREAWQADGVRVVGCAVAARAARELEAQTGIDSATIAALLRDLRQGQALAPGSVLVVDEAAMVGSRELAELADHAEQARAKLVLVGDERQLPEIDAGGGFGSLCARLGALELTEVRRQAEAWDREALAALRDGRAEEWLEHNREHGRIVARQGAEATRAALVSDWWRGQEEVGPEQALILALRRSDVHDLNERARELMRCAGRLGEDEVEAQGRRFAAGDRVLTLERERSVGLINGLRGTVTRVDKDQRSLSVRLDEGRQVELPASYLDEAKLDHGYAMTAHKAQGMTAERTYVLGSDEVYGEWAYTALSRHREEARYYLNAGEPADPERPPSLDEVDEELSARLVRALGRSRAKELALDVWEGEQGLRAWRTDELASEAERLAPLLATYPDGAREPEREAAEAEQAVLRAQAAEERLDRSREERAALRIWERAPRAELERRIAYQSEVAERLRGEAEARAAQGEIGREAGAEWMERHGADAAHLVAIERELAERRVAERAATLRELAVDPPNYVIEAIGPRPDGLAGREEWARAAAELGDYQERFGQVPDLELPPRADPVECAAWDDVREVVVAARNPPPPPPPAPREVPALDPELEIDDFDLGP